MNANHISLYVWIQRRLCSVLEEKNSFFITFAILCIYFRLFISLLHRVRDSQVCVKVNIAFFMKCILRLIDFRKPRVYELPIKWFIDEASKPSINAWIIFTLMLHCPRISAGIFTVYDQIKILTTNPEVQTN